MSMYGPAILPGPVVGATLWGADGLLARAVAMLSAAADRGTSASHAEHMIDSPHGRVPSYVRQSPMLKFIALASRRPDLTPAEFHTRWLTIHGPLTRSFQSDLRIQRYVQTHAVPSPTLDGFSAARGGNPYDGLAEAWFRDEADLAAAFASPEGQKALTILAEDERQFIASGMVVFAAREYELVRTPDYRD